MATTLKYRFAMRRRTATEWLANNEVLLNSEWGYETDTGKLKIGNGSSAWTALSYQSTSNVPEGSNLYFTKARVASSLVQGTGVVFSVDAFGNTTIGISVQFSTLTDQDGVGLEDEAGNLLTDNVAVPTISTTDDLPEGTVHLYFSAAKVQTTPFAPYTLATLPLASTHQYQQIVVTDAAGGAAPCWSNGTNWLKFADNTIVS